MFFLDFYIAVDFGSMRWKVPITIATKDNTAAVKIVLEEETTTVTVDGVNPGDYILVRERRHPYTTHDSIHTLKEHKDPLARRNLR